MSDTSILTDAFPAPDVTGQTTAPATVKPAERPAPDPTRYGDWEKNGRCIDF